MSSPADAARDRAQRQLWDVVNQMSLRRRTGLIDLEAWLAQIDHARMQLAEAARAERAKKDQPPA